MGRSSCRWEKRECGVRWREWGSKGLLFTSKRWAVHLFQANTCVNTLTHAQPYAIFFFEVDVSLNRGHQSRGLVVFHAYRATKPHPGSCPMELGGLLERGASRSLCSKKTERPSCTEGLNTSSGAVTSILLENHCASGSSEHPASPFFFLQIVAVLGQQGAAENERVESCEQSQSEHIKRLLFGTARCLSHSPRLAPLFVQGTCRSPALMLVYEIGKC